MSIPLETRVLLASRLRLPLVVVVLVVAWLAVAFLAGRVAPFFLATGLVAFLALAALACYSLSSSSHVPSVHWRDVMPCYLSVQDKNLLITEINELFRRDFGDGLGRHCYEIYKKRGSPCPNCPVLKTFEDGQIHSNEETVVTRNGQTAQVVVTSAPYRDRQGHLRGVVEMSTNITELKILEQELERSRSEYRRLFDLVPCYISIQDQDLTIVEANDLFRQDFGHREGDCCYEVYKGRETVCQNCIVQKSFENGGVYSKEETVTTKEGERINLIVYSMPLYDEEGKITRVMEVSTDITEVKLLQHQLTLIGRAVAGLAHRIKNILMGLEGGLFVVNTAFETNDQEAITQGWEMIERNVEKVSHIVKDLLYCSKKREPRLEEGVYPETIAQEVFDLFYKRTANEKIDLDLDIGAPHPQKLDPNGVHSLIANLLTNAIDACRFDPDESKERHKIIIRCHADERGGTLLEIEDNGAGIPDEISEKMFEDYFSTKGTEGTGLGLLVIKRILEEHQGQINFTSRPGEGTHFYVTLPPLP